ncbi:unnamed protein product [Musa acuminata subsp. malaccensis]|uniref:(wild Malaysian banana) hypothetical protein n=1 Tax=Musa acuminata subsp. malaccensis TaxID=214687 RepID=A0A804ISJ0_MUSAM|nr:unnamed protein product [Musa acuminata subsp. malaccensis]
MTSTMLNLLCKISRTPPRVNLSALSLFLSWLLALCCCDVDRSSGCKEGGVRVRVCVGVGVGSERERERERRHMLSHL